MHVTTGEMKTILEENTENPSVKNSQPVNDLLMKPFSLGWMREVVRRAVTHSGTPNCDIYYFNPNKKKLRSLIEVKSNLTDGLSLDCFSFKREPLGLSSDLEIVRDAKVRGKGGEKSKEKRNVSDGLRKSDKPESPKHELRKKKTETEEEEEPKPETKRKKTETKEEDCKPETETKETDVVPNAENRTETGVEKKSKSNNYEIKSRRTKSDSKKTNESKNFNNKSKRKTRVKPTKPVRLQSLKSRKSTLKRVVGAKQAKQAKVVPSRKLLKKFVSKKVSSPKRNLSKAQSDKKSGLKSKKNSTPKIKRGRKPAKNRMTKGKTEVAKVPETNENDKKSIARDLKSIVKKNIGKYREMREKQKLGAVKSQVGNPSRKTSVGVSRPRSEPISKNRPFYLKPLEKGWRRELVYRTNCAKAGQQADVYYFHPNGKKLRSCREVAENLTHGLSIECFTFRKEPIGCGEPSEVVRNAKSFQKN